MLRSMYSGISGMKVNQTKLDVIGNNISNVGTTSFKSSRARFSDMLSQNVSDAMAPSNNQGGVNASQVGLGVQLASIDSVMTQGMMQPTGRQLDVAIDGDGFFMVSKGPAIYDGTLEVNHRAGAHNITSQSLSNSGSEIMYSRDGSFILDEQGNLLTGDGFRVMGYSLTNDDSSQDATGQVPNAVSTAGLDFRFGPGSQLNGFKVVLGSVGPGTVTSADVNKAEKLIIVNGDFSSTGALTPAQVESAINKGLSSAGISQQMFVSGKPISFEGLGSSAILGGTDALAPKAITVGGFTIQLSEGSDLNGYSFEIGEISPKTLEVNVEKGRKKIVINADYLNKGFNSADLQEELNNKLKAAGIKQEAKVTGAAATLGNISGASDASGKVDKAAELVNAKDGTKTNLSVGGFTFANQTDGELNDYTISIGESSAGTPLTVVVENGNIIINGDFTKADSFTDTELKTKLNSALKANGVKTQLNVTGSIKSADITNKVKFQGGVTASSPKALNIAGLNVELPAGTLLNNLEFEITDINEPGLNVVYTEAKGGNPPKLVITGDFTKKVAARDLEDKINEALAKVHTTDSPKVKISGTSKPYTGLTSDNIEGGEVDKAPGKITVGGVELTFDAGAAFNGYKFQIGAISPGTKTSATIDEKGKTITINGDFVTTNAVTAKNIQDALTRALEGKGIAQGITVTGKPMEIGGVVSEETNGGTPIESMNADGSINFVDATKNLKSYDGELKTLKIPDKVRIPGTDTELRVKTYTIDKNGVINGVLEDGRVAALGQLAMASFKNPEGLTKLGGNLYSSSVNSGDSIIKSGVGTLNDDNSNGYGDNLQGMLEMSNVDLSEQFTDMIVSSRAFQASGKMITTGDEILQDIINLKR
ncbi:flagellar hook-basal body complex protein [Clostridium sp.]|uniref:flagellar hook-basal body complex protein n=2 Tax=Clostridium sp. TaxID=1506 RepID=UPI001EC8251A|nr:flagellar hook-basal body complex protein [Clostridium sp.]